MKKIFFFFFNFYFIFSNAHADNLEPLISNIENTVKESFESSTIDPDNSEMLISFIVSYYILVSSINESCWYTTRELLQDHEFEPFVHTTLQEAVFALRNFINDILDLDEEHELLEQNIDKVSMRIKDIFEQNRINYQEFIMSDRENKITEAKKIGLLFCLEKIDDNFIKNALNQVDYPLPIIADYKSKEYLFTYARIFLFNHQGKPNYYGENRILAFLKTLIFKQKICGE